MIFFDKYVDLLVLAGHFKFSVAAVYDRRILNSPAVTDRRYKPHLLKHAW
jgi:hypothetical protein